ncbi:hypothetical protein FO440_14570 [Mucilaginibacter corticis]|uniref:MobA/VirD2-like nuclease domain-containing protein n=1 Tax=Mucilaginibacter corticis TaxID=2597670 RepID=A0A556MM01_9SPHI|nr:relaxase/mobilization nuclease domain-containing protein [Mucilaginibacter corticis]TSJ40957.1 hypothetical protein FO440_14570 [Mucilaginibacter corticis]
MVVKFLKPSAGFGGVYYNTDKITAGQAELMAAVNFELLDALTEVRPQDYVNHLKAVSALNKRISEPQLHVAISTIGREHSKDELTNIAKAWMNKMGYANQPYLVFFHKDTENNHVHIVSTRVGLEGKKISSAFEHVRAVKVINNLQKFDERITAEQDLAKALSYRCSTLSQFKLILELQGYMINDGSLIKSGKKLLNLDVDKIPQRAPDPQRAGQLKAIFKKYAPQFDQAGLTNYLKSKMGVELVFHSKDGKPAYGYTILDHAQKNAYKGSEVMPLKELLQENTQKETTSIITTPKRDLAGSKTTEPAIRLPIRIVKDLDDAAVHGRRRKRKTRGTQR